MMSQHFPVRGRFECMTPGALVLAFDNRFSLMTTKVLTYEVTVLRPAEKGVGGGGGGTGKGGEDEEDEFGDAEDFDDDDEMAI